MLLFLEKETNLQKVGKRKMPLASISVQEFHVHKFNCM